MTKLWMCLTLQREAPACVFAALRQLQKGGDLEIKVAAAAALAPTKACDSTTMSVLREALTSDQAVVAVISAMALVTIGTWNKAAMDLILAMLESREPLRAMPILEGLKLAGPVGRPAAGAVASLIFDESLPFGERQAAAVALGCITRGTTDAVPTLERALFSPSWEVVAGAVRGFAGCQQITDATIERLVVLAESPDMYFRRVAYEGFATFGEQAASAAAALAARIGEEPEPALFDETVSALVALGIAAAAPLVDIIRGGDMRKVAPARTALTAIASQRPGDVLQLLIQDNNSRVRATAALVVADLEEYAAPALPTLVSLLEQASSDEIAFDIVVAMAGCGPIDEAGAATVIRALMRWREIPSDTAQRWLLFMGPEIRSAIIKALGAANDTERVRLEEFLALTIGTEMGTTEQCEDGLFVMFAGIDLALIEVVVRTAALLEKRGAASWPDLLSELKSTHLDDSLVPLELDIAPKSLHNQFKKLGKKLKVTFTRGPQRGKSRLTPEARPVLEKAGEYLKALRVRRGGPAKHAT